MPARQLWFWPPPRPLVERFGADFFRQLPAAPAVYLLCGPGEGILYVGKARNLRRRLAAYRVANPERLPRRLIRLLHQVTRIEWDLCPSEAAASHREAELIAALNPRFNRAGTAWPAGPTLPRPGEGRRRLQTDRRSDRLGAIPCEGLLK